MTGLLRHLLSVLLIYFSFSALASKSETPIVIKGALENYNYPAFEEKIEKIWNHIEDLTGITQLKDKVEAPIIYLSPFLFSSEVEEWVVWQKQWIKAHPEIWDDWKKNSGNKPPIEEGNPFPKMFAAFEYYDSPRIQVNPLLTFIPYYQYDSNGIPGDFTGMGFYSIGHELHHYALNLLKVPMRLHHCIFVSSSQSSETTFMDQLADYLIENKISSSFVKFRAADVEKALNPCAQLSTEDQVLAKDWLNKILD